MFNIRSLTVGIVATNCYLVWNKATGEGVLIDPGDEAERICSAIAEERVKLKAILLTHGHFDHILVAEELKERYEVPLYASKDEKEMLENKIDLAVHSLKDMPQNTPEGLLNACFPMREDNRDVLVSKNGKKLKELDENSVIGTGSVRREKELLNLRNDVKIKAIRGNIHTRLKKLDDGEYDAIVLAAAGLKRVGLENRITEYFDTDSFMPAPGQGILCIQCRENDNKILHLLKIINDDEVTIMCKAEREFSKIFDGGCHTPIGCSSVIEGNTLKLKGMFNDNGIRIFKEVEGNRENPKETAQKLAEEIKEEEMKNEKR